MRPIHRLNPALWLSVVTLAVLYAALPARSGDLPARSDGESLWLLDPTPPAEGDQDDEPKLVFYHLPADTDNYLAHKLEPIKGALMPRGLAAGDGRLLVITTDRRVTTIRPEWSELMRQYEYKARTLAELPEGCTLVALDIGERGPWALVQVQSRELLEKLDEANEEKQADTALTDQQMLNRALGLPDGLEWVDGEPYEPAEQKIEQVEEQEFGPSEAAELQGGVEPAERPTLPAYRLIHLRSNQWASVPLPDNFEMPREAALLTRPGADRPTLLIDSDTPRGPMLTRYNPITLDSTSNELGTEQAGRPKPAQQPAWSKLITGMQLSPGRQWSAELINGQIIVALERFRPREVVTIDTFLLRGDDAYEIGTVNISIGDSARWALLPKQNDIGLIASPPPPPDPEATNRLPTLALFAGLSLDGQALFRNEEGSALLMPIAEKKSTLLEGNADLFIQIIAFITAMFMMIMFYRRAPQQDQLDLPEHLVLASFGRRIVAGMIDLAPGFFLATMIFDISVNETILYAWPGNGVEKAIAAMRPGFVVIAVTLVHTTVCEFILARSLGKILMGMYVADLSGKPAPPMPCLGRALSRAFELFAPLMILVALISPARQRLGDILAKTTVVMRKPEPLSDPEDDNQR
ncbi:MAG: RDD family protein [Planctomycetota bacterium]